MVPGWETVIELFFVPIPFQFLRILLFNPHWNGLGLDMLGLVGESLEAKHPQPLFIANRGFDRLEAQLLAEQEEDRPDRHGPDTGSNDSRGGEWWRS